MLCPDSPPSGQYDPAAWDVWSAGCVLFFLTAAEQVSRKLGGEVFGFFSYTAQACPLTERNQEKIAQWNKCHYAVGGCLFFDADRWGKVRPEKRGENGVPIVDRDENGHPIYPRLWRFLKRQGGMYSPDLKNLLNRMLDVDPRKRIKIEEICSHPWLQSHQAPRNYFLGPQPAPESLEKPEEKAGFMEHMRMRTAKYIESATPGKEVIPTAKMFTKEEAIERITPCLEVNLLPYKPTPSREDANLKDGVLHRISIEPLRTANPRALFTIDVFTDRWEVNWESHHLGCASLSDWHAFSHAVIDCLRDREPVPNPQKMKAIVHTGTLCDISLANPIVGTRYRKVGVDYNLCETAFTSLPEDDKKYYEVIEYVGADPVPWVATVDNPSFVVQPGVREIVEELNLINAQREVLDRASAQLMADLHCLLDRSADEDAEAVDMRHEADLFLAESAMHDAQAEAPAE